MLNLALRKPAFQSSISQYSIGTTHGEDARGGNNGNLACHYGFHTDREQNPWWQVDLEDSFVVQKIVIFNRPDQPQRLRRFTVLGSTDGREWKELFRKADDHVFGRDGEPFAAEMRGNSQARFVRVRLDGHEPLHFIECQVFGVHPDPKICAWLNEKAQQAEQVRTYIPDGRRGRVAEIGGFAVFLDEENYHERVIRALETGQYEAPERNLVGRLITQVDRVIELGTGIGVLSMTAARITGAESVLTVEANPCILNDARDNFLRNGLAGIRSHAAVMRSRRGIKDPKDKMALDLDKTFLWSRLPACGRGGTPLDTVQVPTLCLEDTIHEHGATVLLCDIEGGESNLLVDADLSQIRLIILEAYPWLAGEAATDEMLRQLLRGGFSVHLDVSHAQYLALRRCRRQ